MQVVEPLIVPLGLAKQAVKAGLISDDLLKAAQEKPQPIPDTWEGHTGWFRTFMVQSELPTK